MTLILAEGLDAEATAKAEKLSSDLDHFIGSETYTKVQFTPAVMTDGALHLANEAGAHWLMGEIGVRATKAAKVFGLELHFWKLKRTTGNRATLTAESGIEGEKPKIRFNIPFTDFPFKQITLYAGFSELDGKMKMVIHLPSEH